MAILNRVQQNVSGTPGTGAVTLGTAVTGYDTFANAGAVNAGTYSYVILEGSTLWEYGIGTYSTSGPTLTRTTIIRSSAGTATAATFSSAAVVICDALAEDFAQATVADVRTGTDTSKLVNVAAWMGSAAQQTLTDGATVAWNVSSGYNAKVTLGGNRILTISNGKEGMTYVLQIIQDGSGSRLINTWPTSFNWGSAGVPTLSTAAGKIDFVFAYCYDAATPKYRCTFSKDA